MRNPHTFVNIKLTKPYGVFDGWDTTYDFAKDLAFDANAWKKDQTKNPKKRRREKDKSCEKKEWTQSKKAKAKEQPVDNGQDKHKVDGEPQSLPDNKNALQHVKPKVVVGAPLDT